MWNRKRDHNGATKSKAMSTTCMLVVRLSSAFVTNSCRKTFLAPKLWLSGRQVAAPIQSTASCLNMVYAPPGSGYYRPEEESSYLPETYEPLMEYPGTMRPGRTKENQPYSSLPIADHDPDPVPWPHFQEIEWHHQWLPPHEHPIPMEEFIEMQGRWATVEMEAEMRAGARRGVRERRAMEEVQKSSNLIVDDDDDDDDDGPRFDLGEGVELLIGSKSTKPTDSSSGVDSKKTKKSTSIKGAPKFSDDDDEDADDDFLLDLGLSDDVDEAFNLARSGAGSKENKNLDEPTFATGKANKKGVLEVMQTMIDSADEIDLLDEDPSVDMKFDDFDLDFSDEDTDDDGVDLNMLDNMDISNSDEEVQLDDFVGNEDVGDDDNFDDGGYDYGYDDNDYDSGGNDYFS